MGNIRFTLPNIAKEVENIKQARLLTNNAFLAVKGNRIKNENNQMNNSHPPEYQ